MHGGAAEGGDAREVWRDGRDVVAAGNHNEIVAACDCAEHFICNSDDNTGITVKRHRLHG